MALKQHTTNYTNTFIEVAEDCPVAIAEVPRSKGSEKTAALLQYEMIAKHPYKYTSDDVLFLVYAEKNDLTQAELEKAREMFFSKGQPCFRASPLTKRYGFGVHADEKGKIALYGRETDAYKKLAAAPGIKKLKAMRSSRK
ncbi:MAG: DUF6157 family protein [Niabella sp.]